MVVQDSFVVQFSIFLNDLESIFVRTIYIYIYIYKHQLKLNGIILLAGYRLAIWSLNTVYWESFTKEKFRE